MKIFSSIFRNTPLSIAYLFFSTVLFPKPGCLNAQKINNIWAFGDHAGIDFNFSPPVAMDTTSIFHRDYGPLTYASSICDKNGKLLFYTNGYNLWDRMNNGIDKYRGRWPWTFFVMPLFCPYPANDSLTYLFGVSTNGANAHKLIYVSLNKNGNGGMGEVVYPQPSTETNYYTELLPNASLYIAGTSHCNGRDIWITGHSGNAFYSYLVTGKGINPLPVISNIPQDMLPADKYIDLNIKFSANGEKLILPSVRTNKVLVFDFDNQTGIFLNPKAISFPDGVLLDGAEISADGSKLYVGTYKQEEEAELHYINQMDLNAGSSEQIIQSSYLLTKNPDRGNFCSPHFCVFLHRTLEMGPDGRIYISMLERTDRKFDTHSSVIEQPNEKGDTCLYKRSYFDLKRLYKYINFNYVRSQSFTPKENGIQFKRKICDASPVHFSLLSSKIDSVKWDFGDIPSGQNNYSTSKTPSHQYPKPGVYTVKAIMNTRCFTDTATAEVTISPEPAVHIPSTIKDTTVCIGTTIVIDVTTPDALKYEWENGFNRPAQEIDRPGVHTVKVTNECSFDVRSFNINFEKCNCEVYVPNAYTPNGDQLNDLFRPIVKCLGLSDEKDFKFSVYDRFGAVIYTTKRKDTGWNGLVKNSPAPAGTYSWVLQYVNPNTKKAELRNGSVTVIR